MRQTKDSGIEWIGEIPEDWNVTHLKYLCNLSGGSEYTSNDFVKEKEGALILSPSNFSDGKMKYDKCSYISWDKYSKNPNTHVSNGDILYVKTGSTYGKTCQIYDLPCDATINPQILVLKNIKINSRYLNYYMSSSAIGYQTDISVTGGTIPTISQDKINGYFIVFPDLESQNKISKFLDTETSKTNQLIDNLNNQIEKLKDYKKALITRCVTKGLDSNVPLKDSGTDWIGNVPEKWTIVKGRRLFNQRSTKGNNIVLQLLSPTQKYGVVPQDMYEELSGMAAVKLQEGADLSLLKTIHKGDFCISLRSFQGGFEYSSYEGVVSPAYHVFYPIVEIDDAYYKYMFKSDLFIFKMRSYPLTLRDGKNISFSDFGDTLIPYPPAEEQHKIGLYLDKKCSEIDALISSKQQQIDKLNEYQKSLIYEYVTGKKEVV